MTRWTFAGCMALAALGAATVLDVGSATAEAAPSVSRFAGTYVWAGLSPTITISDGGQITGDDRPGRVTYVYIRGHVGADGSYSFMVKGSYEDDSHHQGQHFPQVKFGYKSTGNMALDVDGNIVGTDDAGGSFVWLRQ